ncbi:hypothetical protein N7462_008599 [Penicillium macrosclerotiorum]|uniref:uncharacterized protein n=1 Tax=Penicillium macrosclerotiorum TaxID=303699 RepID=UPI002546ED40|nr:uncharacterized protein N7462_008599 [Penicillium macrosclerotiorum]KAJ5675702.1 hypothetical protein N7462_008599 [Penicillium macrosclerotiorum]
MSSQNSFVNASLSSNTVGAGSSSTSAVRSRPRRLVSFMDDEDDDLTNQTSNYSYQDAQPFTSGLSTTLSADVGSTRSRGGTPSPLSSRGVSPMPIKRPSRTTESLNRSRYETSSLGLNGSSKMASSRGAVDFLDSSWSSLQSLASSVLGSDTGRSTPSNTAKTHTRRKPSRSDVYIRSMPRSSPSTWGPSAPVTPEIGVGTKEERQALVQAKKREALLLADADPISSRNFRHKRRDSGDYFDQPLDCEHDEEALAYIHPVQATDSITGVTIKYGCQPAIFRKANGFWPNDNIQSRKTVLLPVDACTVKGRPVQATAPVDAPVDLLNADSEDPTDSSIAPPPVSANGPPIGRPTPTASNEAESNQIWKHENWVNIDGFPVPIEIGRVPRRALGFFPRTRRKSVSFTDTDSPYDSSQELTRTPSPTGSPQMALTDGVLPRTRFRGDQSNPSGVHPSRPQHRRQRSSVHLSGTGVGTLDRTATGPGPALDGLTKFFSQHMPHLAPPPPPQNLRRSSFGSESTVTSNASTGLENIGGAVEGWIRKVATRTKAGISELQQGSPQTTGRGRSAGIWGMGDLIELDDASEGRRSPSVLGSSRRPELQGSSSSSSFRVATASASATSRPRGTGFGSGSNGYGARTKDD